MSAIGTMRPVASPDSSGLSEGAWSGAYRLDTSSHTKRASRAGLRGFAIEGTVAAFAGSIIAVGWAVIGAAGDVADGLRAQLERELTQMASPLAELSRLERAGENGKAAAAQLQARTRPIVELRSLLEALSRAAHAGVTISRLQRSDEGIEVRVRAADSAACASWGERLAKMRALESAETTELKSIAASAGPRGEHAVEAVVRLRWRGAPPSSPLRRAALGGRERAEREAR